MIGVEIEIGDKMMRNAFIGYDAKGNAIITGALGVGSIKHSDAIVSKFVVGRDTWDELCKSAEDKP